MIRAGQEANRRGIPVILDPVGVGATHYRYESVHRLLGEVRMTVIRGNASEIRALFYSEMLTKGVDTTHSSEDAVAAARGLSEAGRCVVCISGATDLIVSDGRSLRVGNGHPMMSRVTGLGCTATALVGAFAAVNPDTLCATADAMCVLGIAGEIAAERSAGPGSLQLNLLDALYLLSAEQIAARVRLSDGVSSAAQ